MAPAAVVILESQLLNQADFSGWHRQAKSSDSCLRRNDVTPAKAGVGDGDWTVRKTIPKAYRP